MFRKKQLLFFGGCLFFGSIWLMISQLETPASDHILKADQSHLIGDKLKVMEKDLETNKKLMNEIQNDVSDFLKQGNVHDPDQRNSLKNVIRITERKPVLPQNPSTFNNSRMNDVCLNIPYKVTSSDVNMINVYKQLPFDDQDGGVWKQGFDIQTSDSEWNGKQLKVFVVPHSHNDPGWIKTLDKYFYDQTQHILNTVVDSLMEDSNRRFIWAEMSYLSMWWDIATPQRKENAKKLVNNGQLEIVTGGWVMNDEANTHYSEMIDQMIEGNDWLYRTFGVIPRSGWAIDPFGHSPTMTYILKKMKFENMLIQRTHYAVKKQLAKQQSLEFRWRQAWDSDTHTDMTCHMMPFYSYDVPHTCGPDPKICCQFDFARLPGFRLTCPWRVPPVAIENHNVEARSKMLLDQYRKKSKLFRTNTLLVILGDDFRYTQKAEADAQFNNYNKIFSYVNSHPELNAKLQFGTLSEYFDAMKTEIGGENKLPALTGDFFTYADREDHYWSGYYTSRPYHKMQDRVLAAHLRAAEVIFSLALPVAKKAGETKKFSESLYPLLIHARRNLGLFQHHDGITGTAKDVVVVDYGTRLMRSLMDCKKVIVKSAEILLLRDVSKYDENFNLFEFDEVYSQQSSPPSPNVVNIPESQKFVPVVLYNSLAYERSGVVRLIVSSSEVEVTSSTGDVIPSQTSIVWSSQSNPAPNKFELYFNAVIPPLGLTTYKIRTISDSAHNTPSKVEIFNQPGSEVKSHDIFTIKPGQVGDIHLDNGHIIATVSSQSGYLQSVANKQNGIKTKANLNFVSYTSRMSKDKSGAYLFLPAGDATPHVSADHRPLIRHISGPIMSEVQVLLPNVMHRLTVYAGDGRGPQHLGLHVINTVDVRSGYDNKEIAMRVTSDITSDSRFYSDLNGFQTQARTTYSKLPIQANFYPMPAMAFIQDGKTRLTLLTGQPLGVASLRSGQLEVIMDRRLMQDDNRGLGQGVTDNVPTPESFVIMIEQWDKHDVTKNDAKLSYPSMAAHMLSWQLLHPVRSMTSSADVSNLQSTHVPLTSLPCDVFLLNLRTMHDVTRPLPSDETALLLHRVGYECDLDSGKYFQAKCATPRDNNLTMESFFTSQSVCETSLSLQHQCKSITRNEKLNLKTMDIKAYKLKMT
uniref:Alpha-mannosidase n=1 Tax=Phallusia mammillata TaxID=59560 RepID=A0A6F9DJI1_9ASCI|nr:alpha-mannosidase 2 [Phallusia mammillata]